MTDADDHIAPGELLDEHGNVDVSKVTARTSTAGTDKLYVTADRCTAIRERLRAGESAAAVAADLNARRETIYWHARGECGHHAAEVDAPAVTYDRDAGAWRADGVRPSALIDETGRVDARSATASAPARTPWIDAATCATIRHRLRRGGASPDVAADLDVTAGAVRDHAAGRCRHDDADALVYVRERGYGWVPRRLDGDATVTACPECDSASGPYQRQRDRGERDRTWLCRECGARFDAPTVRTARHTGDTRKGLAGRLSQAPAEEVGDD
jgi:hypothetical protein